MPRFVVLHHICPSGYPRPTHWDLMLESDGGLRTWALASEPTEEVFANADSKCEMISAAQLPDHRLEYLQIEGALSGNRGEVIRWDEGEYQSIDESPMEIRLELSGKRLQGRFQLRREISRTTDATAESRSVYWLFGRM